MNDPVPPHALTGQVLAHYEIQDPLGEGAMGEVFRAHDAGLERSVAVKVLSDRVARDHETVERFAREARAAARLSHPNVTHVYFVGEQEGRRFFAMELVAGHDLEEHVRAKGPLSLHDGIDVLVQTARGLRAAHEAGVVHRDVKPSNVILRPDGIAKITDFGLAKPLDGDVLSTQVGQLLGTPAYMSPEQCQGDATDPRTDIYALGMTAWYLFTGATAFEGTSVGKIINDHINTPLPRLTRVRPDLPEGLERLLARMCAKRPEDRPGDMAEVIAGLESLRPRTITPAPLMARGLAVGVDLAATLVLWSAFIPVLGLFGIDLQQAGESRTWLPIGIFAVVWVGIHLVTEWFGRVSVGKWMLNMAVVRDDGNAPSRQATLLRFAARYPFMPLYFLVSPFVSIEVTGYFDIGGLVALVAGAICYLVTRGRTLSDKLTHTRVTYQQKAET